MIVALHTRINYYVTLQCIDDGLHCVHAVGYGDITAVTVPERLWAILMICVGATMFAYYLGIYIIPN